MNTDLLTIDMESALRKLSLGRLKSKDHVPLAVLRSFAGLNPSSIRVKVSPKGFVVEHHGKGHSEEVFFSLAKVLDRTLSDSSRREALDRLESLGQLDLLAAFCSGAKKTTWYCPGLNKALSLEKEIVRILPIHRHSYDRIECLQVNRRWKKQLRELSRFLRFAPYELVLNGKRLTAERELSDSVFHVGFANDDIFGKLGIPKIGLAACTYIVVDGVLEREAWESPQTGAVWEAVVHCGKGQSSMALSAVHDHLTQLFDSARDAYPSLAEKSRLRIKEIFFRMADRSPGISLLSGIPMFQTFSGRMVSIEQVIAMGKKNAGVIEAISDKAPPGNFIMNESVFILDEMEREFFDKHLSLLITEPQRTPISSLSLSNLVHPLGLAWSEGKKLLLSKLSARILDESSLDGQERLLLRALQWVLDEGYWRNHAGHKVAMGTGGILPWRWVKDENSDLDTLVLRRSHPTVKKMVKAINERHLALLPIVMLISEALAPEAGQECQIAELAVGILSKSELENLQEIRV